MATGSVYQRSSDGRWVAALWVGGRKLTRYAPTKKQAQEKLAALQRELGLGHLAPPTRLTLAQWADQWLAGKTLRASSRATYRRALAAWCGVLGTTRLHRLTPATLQALLWGWQRDGVGARSLQQRWAYLHACLADAVRLGLLPANPLDQVPKPQARPTPKVYWTPEQAQAFLVTALASDRAHADLITFLLLTGLRLSEALALTPARLEQDLAHIAEGLVWVDGRCYPEAPKSRTGRRRVVLVDLAQAILARRAAGKGLEERLFTTRSGSPPRKDNLARLMAHLCREAGVPRLALRDLRHVHASLLVRGGLDPKSLRAHLGHSRASLSLDVYAYSLPAGGRVVEAWDLVMGS